jgi:hypothetical protein
MISRYKLLSLQRDRHLRTIPFMRKISIQSLFLLFLIGVNSIITEAKELKVIFSHERGFYWNSFSLTITGNIGGCNIKYTLDGSDPKTSQNSKIQTSPATINISPNLTSGRAATPGVVVRACAVRDKQVSTVETHTYIFLNEVKFQSDVSPDKTPYWPSSNYIPNTYPANTLDWMRSPYQLIDLGVDPEVVSKDEYYDDFNDALLAIPSVSLVMDPKDLFDPDSGIYINPIWPGKEWERPGSFEIIYPSVYGDAVQSNAGVRIRGGWSRKGNFPKHSFRLFFREEYGNDELNYPLFDIEGVDKFKNIDIRCTQNNSWHVPGRNSYADFIHDLVARDMQRDMGHPYTRSREYHLYINGMYWGLYQTEERPEADYAASYFGGNKEDYDIIKSSGPSTDLPSYTLQVTDGDTATSKLLWNLAKEGFTNLNYYKAMGLNPDGTKNPNYKVLLDAVNLADYMILIYYCANTDGPAELDGGERINNFYGILNRNKSEGFKFFMHDTETAFENISDDITGRPTTAGEEFERFNPAWLHQKLMKNKEYCQLFADRAYKHLFNNGILTVANNISRFQTRANEIDMAIIGESARWGDAGNDVYKPYTKNDNWKPVITKFIEKYFPARTNVVINQFRNKGWLNNIVPPSLDSTNLIFTSNGVYSDFGNTLKLVNKNSSGEIYYSINNIDPRNFGDSVANNALKYSAGIPVNRTVFLKARIKDGVNWSPLMEQVIALNTQVKIKITEISYNPGDQINGSDTIYSNKLEFIEIKNFSTQQVDLSGYKFTKGINYTFPVNSIVPSNGFYVITSDTISFKNIYGFFPSGQFDGKLKNEGEQLLVKNCFGDIVVNTGYNISSKWYKASDGMGYSLVFKDYSRVQGVINMDDWRVSTNKLGSPGKDDPEADTSWIKITEVIANSKYPYTDAIELYNESDKDIDVSNWYLTDRKRYTNLWKIPVGSIIHAKDYAVFFEGHYENSVLTFGANEFGNTFSLSSGGETIYLLSSDSAGKAGSLICEYEYGTSDENISIGEYTNSVGYTTQLQLDTVFLGKDNLKPRKSPLIFTTINYHPVSYNCEFLVLKNRTDSVLHLYLEENSAITWKIDGLKFEFPGNISLNAGDSLFLVEKAFPASTFRTIMNIGPGVQVFNYEGKLKNSNEIIAILKPILINKDSVEYAYVCLESVWYNDSNPWPESADGKGYALERINGEAYADDPINWRPRYNTIPYAIAGNDKKVRINSIVNLDGSSSSDPAGLPLTYNWILVSKPTGSKSVLTNATSVKNAFTPDVKGNYILSLQVDNGKRKSSLSYMSVFASTNNAPVAIFTKTSYIVKGITTVSIDGSRSYDPDYDDLEFKWEFKSKPAESRASLEKYNNQKVINFTPDTEGIFVINFIVSDGDLSCVSKEITVNYKSLGIDNADIISRMNVYPNPSNDFVYIETNLKNSGYIKITLSDIDGRIMHETSYPCICSGSHEFSIDLNSLNIKAGMYFIKIDANEFTETKKVIYSK